MRLCIPVNSPIKSDKAHSCTQYEHINSREVIDFCAAANAHLHPPHIIV